MLNTVSINTLNMHICNKDSSCNSVNYLDIDKIRKTRQILLVLSLFYHIYKESTFDIIF